MQKPSLSQDDINAMGDYKEKEMTLEHGEGVGPRDVAADNRDALKSSFDDLSEWQTILRFKKAVLVCILLCIAAAADGYQINLNGNIIANVGFTRHLGVPNAAGVYLLPANNTALWGALQSLGQLIGMIFLNPVSDRLGRKVTMYVLWVILFGSILLETLVRDWKDWAGAKLLAGVGVGCLQATLPIYISEWSPVNIRGSMIIAYTVFNQVGNFLAPLVLYIKAQDDPNDFKTAILTQWGFLGIMLPIFIWLPETAAYYAARDQHDKGLATLRRVNGNVVGYDAEAEYAIIQNTMALEKARSAELPQNQGFRQVMDSYLECFRGSNLLRTLGSTLPACCQQLTGLSFLNTYASLFFRQSGFTNAFQITAIITGIKIAMVLVLLVTSDRFGRRKMVLWLTYVATAMMGLVGILGLVNKTTALKNLLIFSACVWSCASAGLGAFGWAFVGEVSSQKLRARTAGVAAAGSVLFGLTFNTSVPIMLDVSKANLGYNTAWIFFGTGVVASVIAYFFVPEASKRNPAELDEMFEKGIPARRMRLYVTDIQKSKAQEVDAQ